MKLAHKCSVNKLDVQKVVLLRKPLRLIEFTVYNSTNTFLGISIVKCEFFCVSKRLNSGVQLLFDDHHKSPVAICLCIINHRFSIGYFSYCLHLILFLFAIFQLLNKFAYFCCVNIKISFNEFRIILI